jgi:hypothetical protein
MLERDRKWAAKMGREFDAKVRPIGRARRRGGAPAFSLARILRSASRRRRRRRHASAPPALLFSARRLQAEERLKRDYFGDKDKIVVMDDGKGMYLWDWFIPLAPCAHKERVGTIGDGGKWVCDMARYEKMPAVSGWLRAGGGRSAARAHGALAAASATAARLPPPFSPRAVPAVRHLLVWRARRLLVRGGDARAHALRHFCV